jgi:hypothetical protein
MYNWCSCFFTEVDGDGRDLVAHSTKDSGTAEGARGERSERAGGSEVKSEHGGAHPDSDIELTADRTRIEVLQHQNRQINRSINVKLCAQFTLTVA